jgi:hypothetical protein
MGSALDTLGAMISATLGAALGALTVKGHVC